MLHAAEAHLRRQHRFSLLAITAARRAWRTGAVRQMLGVLTLLQQQAARDGANSIGAMLAEQGIDIDPAGTVAATALAGMASDGRPLGTLLGQADSLPALELMAVTQVTDASRVAAGVAIAARPGVGWVRMVSAPCCPRCAVLAGKWFRWNTGFQRHPQCDCRHIPAREDTAGDVRTDPGELWRSGQVHGLTGAEQKALAAGSDFGRVVNARRSLYMDPAGRRLTRELTTRVAGPRPTPEEIYRRAGNDQAAAIRTLTQFGYLL